MRRNAPENCMLRRREALDVRVDRLDGDARGAADVNDGKFTFADQLVDGRATDAEETRGSIDRDEPRAKVLLGRCNRLFHFGSCGSGPDT